MIDQNIEHNGIVVYFDTTFSEPVAAIVLDLDHLLETRQPLLKKISQEAFHVPREVEDAAERKRLERKLSIPLIYGQQIRWNINDMDSREMIKKFKKTGAIIKTRVNNGDGQILLNGLINPERRDAFYTEYFQYTTLPEAMQGQAIPNVYVEAWISCNVSVHNGSFHLDTPRFVCYENLCSVEKQIEISQAPWNKDRAASTSSAFTNLVIDDSINDRESGNIAHKNPVTQMGQYKKAAYLTGPRTFMLVDLPHDRCVIALAKNDPSLIIGRKYFVDCFWNVFQDLYVVCGVDACDIDENLPVDPESGMIKCKVTRNLRLQGVFHSDRYGLVDDPFGVLALLHLTKYKDKSIPVALMDRLPSRHGQMRFSISGFAHKFKEKAYRSWIRDSKIELAQVSGIVVEQGAVSSGHMPQIFNFSEDDNPPRLGTHIIFDAICMPHEKNFKITRWAMNPDKDVVPVVSLRVAKEVNPLREKHIVYGVSVRMVALNGEHHMLYCDELGLIDDPLNLVPVQPDIINYDVWVKTSTYKDSYVYPPRTPYHIVEFRPRSDAKKKDSIEERSKSDDKQLHNKVDTDARTNGGIESSTAFFSEKPLGFFPPVQSSIPGQNRFYGFKWHDSALAEEESKFRNVTERATGSPSLTNTGTASAFNSIGTEHQTVGEATTTSDDIPHSPNGSFEEEVEGSIVIAQGGVNPAHHSNRNVGKYFDPVLASPNNEGHKYNVLETLSRLKHTIPHGECGDTCAKDCPWIHNLAYLLVHVPSFHDELKSRHLGIYQIIADAISNVNTS